MARWRKVLDLFINQPGVTLCGAVGEAGSSVLVANGHPALNAQLLPP